jgi:hypothetical protein
MQGGALSLSAGLLVLVLALASLLVLMTSSGIGIGILIWHWHLCPLLAIDHIGNSSVITTLIHPTSSCSQQRCGWCVGSVVVSSRMRPLPPCKQELTAVALVGMWVLHWHHFMVTTKLESKNEMKRLVSSKKKKITWGPNDICHCLGPMQFI